MFFMPPRHSKSEEVSRLFTAYYLYKFPSNWVGLTSYGDALAMSLSMDSRDHYLAMDRKIREDASAKKEWRTTEGGGLWAAGAGGPITGKGFHLGVIDDPIKNEEEAMSETIREGINRWYDSTWYTRREPNAVEILIMTRWHEHDLAGYLLEKEKDEPRAWHIVCLQALKEEAVPPFPATCTVEPDWRKLGEALCPERFDATLLNTTKGLVGNRTWTSLFQQRPSATEGDIWKRQWFKKFKLGEEPVLSKVGYDWDCAYTKDDVNSASAYIKAGVHGKDIYILDFDALYVEFPELIKRMADLEGPHYVEQKASGKSAVQTLKVYGIAAKEVPVKGREGDKIGRTTLATPATETGHVYVANHIYDRLLDDPRQGLLRFPNATHTDVNDAYVQMTNRLFKRPILNFMMLGAGDAPPDNDAVLK